MDDIQTCPRRMHGFGPWDREERLDLWRTSRGYHDCSFCGSLHPDELMAALETGGAKLTPTDKSYKVYVDLPEHAPDELRVVSAITHDNFGGMHGWVAVGEREREILDRDGWRGTEYKWAIFRPRGPERHMKFYFQHLSDEQRVRFVELYNNRSIALEYPGYFYTRPFFAVPATS